MSDGHGVSLVQQHAERLAGRGERLKVVLLGAGARHQEALDPTAVAVERARTKCLERVAGSAPGAEAAEVELDEGRVIGEHGDGKSSHVCEGSRQGGRQERARAWRRGTTE